MFSFLKKLLPLPVDTYVFSLFFYDMNGIVGNVLIHSLCILYKSSSINSYNWKYLREFTFTFKGFVRLPYKNIVAIVDLSQVYENACLKTEIDPQT